MTNVAPQNLEACRGSSFDETLRVLVAQAWELRASPYLRDAVEAIVDAHDRRALEEFERRQESEARLFRLFRSPDVPAAKERAA